MNGFIKLEEAADRIRKSKRSIQRYVSKLSATERINHTRTDNYRTYVSISWIDSLLNPIEQETQKYDVMDILEKELEDMLFNAIDAEEFKLLENRGLALDSEMTYGRQVHLRDAGVADIIGFKTIETETEFKVAITVIELKRNKLSIEAFAQANRYLYYIEEMLDGFFSAPLESRKDFIIESNIVLIGSGTTKDIKELANTFSDKFSAYEYRFSLLHGCEFSNVDEFWIYENEIEALDNIELFSIL